MTLKIAVALAVGMLAAGSLTGSAHAAEPAEQACLGKFFSGVAGRGFGQDVSFFAQNADTFGLKNLGEGIQNLQAGEAPLFPDVCNSTD